MVSFDDSNLPRYEELPGPSGLADAPRETSWGVFGDRYQLGTLNFLTPERVKAAAGLVRTGKRINLNLPLNHPPRANVQEGSSRDGYTHRHEVMPGDGYARDEVLDHFNPQASSQWDGLAHVFHPRYKNYNGVPDSGVRPGDESLLSIGNWTKNGGIVCRGVLLDIPRYAAAAGIAYTPASTFVITPEIIEACAVWEKVEIKHGDVLIIRTGVLQDMLENPTAERRNGRPGLGPARPIAAFLWNNHIVGAASDNGGLEVSPRGEGRSLHMAMLPMLGMPMGELWALDELAEDCASDGVYEFMLVSVPMYLPGGIGSPPNAVAIK